ncbi:MAG: potassium channel protein [Deltaproteobacteria bacterium]|nr:potassium channel protein [Deltaproteobacteria bacterium]MBW2077410.1 potassium channel protein [Deltaproteobacteria bacterium]MBW2311368.1 potassium channel protein [Deltaproteobacteria bacterium]RLB29700.1 MAG: potassium channel protein [Deltaproteobacteria bacterium]
MRFEKRLLVPAIVILIAFFTGITGYMLIEGWNFLDSIYMTIITLSTVGYGEVHEVGPGGRIFTVFLILFGIMLITYTAGWVTKNFIEGELREILGRRKLGKQIKSLRDHYIICGYGRIGKIICQELSMRLIPLVIIEKDERVRNELEHDNILYLDLDATQEETLTKAGVEKAKGLISVVGSDPENVYICLTARGLNPGLFILSRAEDEGSETKLHQAGANKVILPYRIGGRRMAQAIIRPTVSDFLESAIHDQSYELNIEEIAIGEDSQLNNLTLGESGIRQEMDIIIIGIEQKDGTMVFNPSSQTKIVAGDILIAMGRNRDLERLRAALLQGKSSTGV